MIHDPIDNFGYYVANNKNYYSKIEAVMDLPPGNRDLRWWFHDETFKQFDWMQEPAESLDQLYLERAKQLRDQFDHLVLCYSGGSDSTQILETFDRNNIPVDEILFFGAFSQDKTREFLSTDPSFYNAEIYNIAEPRIDEYRKKWPNVRVTHFDWSDPMMQIYNQDNNQDWIYSSGARLTPNMAGRGAMHTFTRDLRKLHDSNKSVGFVWGVDKPRIIYKEGGWYIFFLDLLVSLATNMHSRLQNNINEIDEFFYWSPYSTKMLCKQAHCVKRYIESDPARMEFFKQMSLNNLQVEEYYDLIKPAVYPTTHRPGLLQCSKAKPVYTQRDWWFYERGGRAFEAWESGLASVANSVDGYWFNGQDIKKGMVGSPSPFYRFA